MYAAGRAPAGSLPAAALGLLTRDRGEVPLAFQLLIYPMLDDRTVATADPHPYAGEFIWTVQANRFGWRALLRQEPGGPAVSPYAAAARAEYLEGLPATFGRPLLQPAHGFSVGLLPIHACFLWVMRTIPCNFNG